MGPSSVFTFFEGWRRGFFADEVGLVSFSLLRLVVVAGVSVMRLRFRVDFGVYSALSVEGASESSESDSSSFFTLLFAILGDVGLDW